MHWLEQHYGELRQGYRLLLSACDFLAVLGSGVPDFWQNVLALWGMIDAPVPYFTLSAEGVDVADVARQQACAQLGFEAVWHRGEACVALPQQSWTLMRVAMEPLAYNQHLSGVWGACVHEPRASADVLMRSHHEQNDKACLVRVSRARRDMANRTQRPVPGGCACRVHTHDPPACG